MPPPSELGALTRDLSFVAFGSVLLAAGLAALLLPAVHRPARNLSLASFGVAVLLYGLRILADLQSFRAATAVSPLIWEHAETICTYFLPVAVFVFTDHYWGVGRYSSLRRVWQIHLTYAVIATGIDVVTNTPAAARGPNGPMVIVWMALVLGNLATGGIRIRREDRFVGVGLVVLVVLVINDNLVGLGLVPWTIRGEPLGITIFVSTLGYSLALRTFSNERRLATLDYELRTARQIQQALLPRALPDTGDGALAVRYIPMAAVGGDLYDYLTVDRHRFGVLVADVTGHGIPAALIASMVKSAAASQARNADRPSDVLSGINRQLCGQVDGHYVTAVYLYLDLGTRRASVATAGHPPPLLLSRDDQTVHEVGEAGLMLGFLPDAEYPTTELPLAPRDRLVLYTDGVVEAASPRGEFFEPERLREMLRNQSQLSPERWSDSVLEALTQWRGREALELDDDLTLVVFDVPIAAAEGATAG